MANVIEITDSNFEKTVKQAALPVLVDFWAPWCGPCRMLGPIVEQVASALEGKVVVGKVNVDENPQISAEYGITSIPALFIFQGGALKDKSVGVASKDTLISKLNKILE